MLHFLRGCSMGKPKTHCPHGHEYSPENTYWQTKRDRREWRKTACCRKCAQLRMARKRLDPEFLRKGAERQARWRRSNPEVYRARWERAHAEKKQILDEARSGGCIRCGESDVACLDFHHRNGLTDKKGHIGFIRRFSIERIRAEIAKCDVLCVNCHRKHHRDVRQSA